MAVVTGDHARKRVSKDSKEDVILAGIAQSVREAKFGNTQPIDTLWNQL